MSFGRKKLFFAMTAAALGSAAVLPMATGFAFESEARALEESDSDLIAAGGLDAADTNPFDAARETEEPVIALDDSATLAEDEAEAAEAEVAFDDTVDADLICMVKVVRHEAANQSRTGQLAVAQLIMNRVNSSRFPNTICGVVHQPGQFFNTNAYHPSQSDRLWQMAMEVSLDARNGVSEPVIGDAVFYHAAYAPSRFHSRRPRVAQIEDHIFYR